MATVIQDIIIPEKSSECSEWISYFKKLEEKFGAENAKTIWLKTWQVNGSTAACTSRPDFNAFFKKQDIDVTNIATSAVASAADCYNRRHCSFFVCSCKGFQKYICIRFSSINTSRKG